MEAQTKKDYKQTEIGIIPIDWEIHSIGDIFYFKNGLNKEKEFFGYGIPIVNYMDVYKNSSITSKDLNGKVSLNNAEIKNYQVKIGDILFTRTSETQEEIGISSVIEEELENTVFSGFLLRARFNGKTKDLDIGFKAYCFSSSLIRKQIISNSSYTTRALTNGSLLSKVNIPIPPLPEQKAIASALKETDVLIQNLEELIAKKKLIKQGAMQELLKPKEDWVTKKLGEVFSITAGGDLDIENFSIVRDEYYCYPIYSNALTNKGLYGFTSKYKHIENTITVTARGEVGCANPRNHKYTAIGRVIILKTIINLNIYFVSEYINNYIKFSNESTGVPQLTAPQISQYEITFPNYQIQNEIASILSDMDSEIDTLEHKLTKYKTIKQGMMQQLLTGKIRLV